MLLLTYLLSHIIEIELYLSYKYHTVLLLSMFAGVMILSVKNPSTVVSAWNLNLKNVYF